MGDHGRSLHIGARLGLQLRPHPWAEHPVVQTLTEPAYCCGEVVKFPDVGLLELSVNVVARYGAVVLPIASPADVSYFTNRGVTVFGYGLYDRAFQPGLRLRAGRQICCPALSMPADRVTARRSAT